MSNDKNNNGVATCASPVYGGGGDPGFNPGATEGATRLHEHLGAKLDDASYLLGFAYSIIEGLTGGLPASDATIAEFRRGYDGYFLPRPRRRSNEKGAKAHN